MYGKFNEIRCAYTISNHCLVLIHQASSEEIMYPSVSKKAWSLLSWVEIYTDNWETFRYFSPLKKVANLEPACLSFSPNYRIDLFFLFWYVNFVGHRLLESLYLHLMDSRIFRRPSPAESGVHVGSFPTTITYSQQANKRANICR